MKLTLFYFSETNNTAKAADWIQEGILKTNASIEVKQMNLKYPESIDTDFLQASKGIIFGTPAYVANMCWQLKKWFDTSFQYKLGGKLGGAFCTEGCLHGGGDNALLSIYNHILTYGMLAYSSGGEFGRPIIHLGPIGVRDKLEEQRGIFTLYGERFAKKATELFLGNSDS